MKNFTKTLSHRLVSLVSSLKSSYRKAVPKVKERVRKVRVKIAEVTLEAKAYVQENVVPVIAEHVIEPIVEKVIKPTVENVIKPAAVSVKKAAEEVVTKVKETQKRKTPPVQVNTTDVIKAEIYAHPVVRKLGVKIDGILAAILRFITNVIVSISNIIKQIVGYVAAFMS